MNCPVCHSTTVKASITLKNSSVYQHPVPNPLSIPSPYTIDLYYQQCSDCSHVYQQGDNQELLESIYTHHYHTPTQSDLGTSFRDDFLIFLQNIGLAKQKIPSLLEVGASSGEMLTELKESLGVNEVEGFEPNLELAQSAREKGLAIYCEFFSSSTVSQLKNKYNVIFSRHVIEHIFDFEDFFNATNIISHDGTRLIIETPSLDWAVEKQSTIAFHIEHIHVFSEYSLECLARNFGWYRDASTVTEAGNLIVSFLKHKVSTKNKIVKPKSIQDIQLKNEAEWSHLNRIAQHKKTILWGAGSCGLSLISSANVKPAYLIDGNKDKAGKYFCGVNQPVEYAPKVIKDLISRNEDANMLVVISSSFYLEIEKELAALGWRGEIYIPEIF